MPNKISPPPTHIKDINNEVWKKWFSELAQVVNDL